MTSKELVANAARRKASDNKVPLYFHFADKPTEKKYADCYGMEQADFYEWLNSDLRDIFLIEDLHLQIQAEGFLSKAYDLGFAVDKGLYNAAYDVWGCAWTIDCLGQELRESPIRDISEVFDYPYPDTEKPRLFYGVQEAIDVNNSGGYASVITQYYTLFERAWAMTGYSEFMMACYTDLDAVEYLLDRITENKVRIAERICELYPTLGHTGDDFGLQRGGVISTELFKKLFKPRYEKIWGVYKKNGIPVVHHSCGDCSMYLEDMIDAGLDILHPVQQTSMDINEIADRFGKDLSFFGSIDTADVMTGGTPDDVRRNVDKTVECLNRYNGLILSMINVMPNAPYENVRAAIEQMKMYGGR